jgi:hypothetical protein
MRLLKMGFEYRFPMNDGIFASPIANTPPDTSLRRKQLDYCRFVLRYGPTHPNSTTAPAASTPASRNPHEQFISSLN